MRYRLLCAFGACAGLALSGLAAASDLRIQPTRLTLTATEKLGSVVLRNEDTKPAAIQVELMTWTQKGTEDHFEPTRELLANPALFEIAPGAEQTIRIGTTTGEGHTEKAYRVFFQEVPVKGAPETDALLRIGIPVFISPMKENHVLQWTVKSAGPNKLTAVVANAGTVHTQIKGLRILDDDGDVVAKEDIFAYILPGNGRKWEVQAQTVKDGQKVHVEASTDLDVIRAQVIVGPHRP